MKMNGHEPAPQPTPEVDQAAVFVDRIGAAIEAVGTAVQNSGLQPDSDAVIMALAAHLGKQISQAPDRNGRRIIRKKIDEALDLAMKGA